MSSGCVIEIGRGRKVGLLEVWSSGEEPGAP